MWLWTSVTMRRWGHVDRSEIDELLLCGVLRGWSPDRVVEPTAVGKPLVRLVHASAEVLAKRARRSLHPYEGELHTITVQRRGGHLVWRMGSMVGMLPVDTAEDERAQAFRIVRTVADGGCITDPMEDAAEVSG